MKLTNNKISSLKSKAAFIAHCSLLIAHCSLLIASCDLFNATDPNYWQRLEEEVAWAKAAKLTVRLDYNQEWGGSNPIRGIISPAPLDIRQWDGKVNADKYKFNLEFTPLPGFYFIDWLAFDSDQYNPSILNGSLEDAKNHSAFLENGIDIERDVSVTGAITATVLITENIPITIVPFCDRRPHITYTNPPLVNSGLLYARVQQITIWIDLGSEDQVLEFGENELGETIIQITGQNTSDGRPYNANGEEGDLSKFYNDPVYNASSRAIIIEPKPNNLPLTEPPPGNLIITVTVGTGVKAAGGEGMAAPVSFSYRTNNELVTRAYKASNVWAIHNSSSFSGSESFFYQTAASDRDRRLRKNDNNDYEVTLYFSVSRSMSEIQEPTPNRLKISQIYYANIAGETVNADVYEDYNKNIEINNEGTGSAGATYRSMNTITGSLGGGYYKATYTFAPGTQRGIYRLAILPYRDDKNDHIIDTWQTAIEEDRFVTIVIDDDAPGGNPNLNLSGHTYIHTAGTITYNAFTEGNSTLVLNPGFNNVEDNFTHGGVLQSQSNPNIPWTKDELSNIQWRWRITGGKAPYESNWISVGTAPEEIDVSDYLDKAQYNNGPVSPQIGNISIRLRDSAGNMTEYGDTINRIIYTDDPPVMAVTAWSATYNESLQVITLEWTTPFIMAGGVRIRVNEQIGTLLYTAVSGTGPQTYNIPVPKRTTNTNGSVTGTADYRIQITAIKNTSAAENDATNAVSLPQPIFITNIKDIKSTEAKPLIPIGNASEFNAIRNELGAGKEYVITSDFSLSSYIPIGSGTAATNAFNGKIYGNGRTITISSMSGTEVQRGLFGTVNGALIRDLNVAYANMTITGPSAITYVGGITGYALGATTIENCSVKGSSASNALTLTANEAVYFGGIIGYTGSTSTVKDSAISLNLTLNNTGATGYALYFGGAAGRIASASAKLTNITVSSTMKASKANGTSNLSGYNYFGGIVGYTASAFELESSSFTGSINATENFRPSGSTYIGGIIGYVSAVKITGANMNGDITVNSLGTASPRVGGIVGYATGASSIENSFVQKNASTRNNISVTTATTGESYVGGIAGYFGGGSIISHTLSTEITVNANITFTNTTAAQVNLGGAIGYSSAGTVSNIRSTSLLTINKQTSSGGTLGGINNIGGIAGSANGTKLSSCNFYNTDITLSTNFKPTGETRLGGLVGTYGSGEVTSCYYATGGSITDNSNSSGTKRIGGLIGFVDNKTASPLVITNSYSNRPITTGDFHSGDSSNTIQVGGLIGQIDGHADISNSYSTGSLTVKSGENLRAGGLIGGMSSYSGYELKLEKVYATGNVSVIDSWSNGNGWAGGCWAGGLIGLVNRAENGPSVIIKQSYATGNIPSMCTRSGNANDMFSGAGGLIGRASGAEISECYAKGSVRIDYRLQTHYMDYAVAGGLVGFLGWTDTSSNGNHTASIRNCYATGDVRTDNTSYLTAAGGLVGVMYNGGSTRNSFACGNVTSINYHTNNNNLSYAGGILGWSRSGSTLSYNVAVGNKDNLTGTYTVARGVNNLHGNRITGRTQGTVSNNYANTLNTRGTSTANNNSTGSVVTPQTHDHSHDNWDGINVTAANLKTQAWWTNANRGFTTANGWNFANITTKGYPTLTNAGGTQ